MRGEEKRSEEERTGEEKETEEEVNRMNHSHAGLALCCVVLFGAVRN